MRREHFQHWRMYDALREKETARGGATVFLRFRDDGVLELHVAVCSWRDNYCKRIGRDIIRGRLEQGAEPFAVITHARDNEDLNRQIHHHVVRALVRVIQVEPFWVPHRPMRRRQQRKLAARS